MPQFTGTLQGGVIIPATPLDLPDGTQVQIRYPVEESVGMREEDWPTTPEGIEEHVRRMQSFEPVVLTSEEEAEIAAWRAEMKRFNIEAVRKQMGLPE